MRWLRKQADPASNGVECIDAGSLEVEFDSRLLRARLDAVMAILEPLGGIEIYIAAMQRKSALFAELLSRDNLSGISGDELGTLVELVFTARRRLPVIIDGAELPLLINALDELLYGRLPLTQRLTIFVETLAGTDRKQQRVVWDFATEMLHYREPERYPLMTRWVWDPNTLSGALRELIAGNDTMHEIPLADTPQAHQAARLWIMDQLNQQGFYRDLHFVTDMLLAKAYADYVEAMSRGMSMMRPDFGRQDNPGEMVEKLLGIDTPRREGKSRVKRVLVDAE